MVQVLRFRYQVPFRSRPPLSSILLPLPSYSPSSIRGLALADAVSDLVAKEAIDPAPPTSGFYSRLLVTPEVTGDRPLTPQRFCGCRPLSYGDYTDRSPVSLCGRLDGVPGSPGRLPPGSGSAIFSLVSEVLRREVGLPVPRALFWPVDGSSGIHPRHGPCLHDHASSWVPDSPVSRRLAGPCFHLPGDCAGEGFSSLALSTCRDPFQSPQALVGSQPDPGLLRNDDSVFSFEGFPDPLDGFRSCLFFFRPFFPPTFIRSQFGVNSWESCRLCWPWFRVRGFTCGLFNSASMSQVVFSWRILWWHGIPTAVRIFCGGPTSPIFKPACP